MIGSAQTYWSLDSPRPNHLELRRWKYWTLPTCSVGLCAFKASRYPLNLFEFKMSETQVCDNRQKLICTPLNFACHRKLRWWRGKITRQEHKYAAYCTQIQPEHSEQRMQSSTACQVNCLSSTVTSCLVGTLDKNGPTDLPPPDRNLATTVKIIADFSEMFGNL